MKRMKNTIALNTELRGLENLATLLWGMRDNLPEDTLKGYILNNCEYEYSEGMYTSLYRVAHPSEFDSQEEFLEELVFLARTPRFVFPYSEDFAEEGKINAEAVIALIKKIIASVYTGKSSNITKLQGLDGEPLGEGNMFGYNPEDGTLSGRFLGSGDDPIEYTIYEDKIKYGTAKEPLK